MLLFRRSQTLSALARTTQPVVTYAVAPGCVTGSTTLDHRREHSAGFLFDTHMCTLGDQLSSTAIKM